MNIFQSGLSRSRRPDVNRKWRIEERVPRANLARREESDGFESTLDPIRKFEASCMI